MQGDFAGPDFREALDGAAGGGHLAMWERLMRSNGWRSVGDAYVGNVDAEGGGEGNLVILLLEEDLAEVFG